MAEVVLMKGNEVIGETLIRAGTNLFAGYPITPSSEMLEYMSAHLEPAGGHFIQAESELAAATMVAAASTMGGRALTVTSGPGLSLMMETLNKMCVSRLPGLFIDVQRAATTIFPEQSDYNYVTKGLGQNGLRGLVYAPANLQEAVDIAYNCYDKAEEYDIPVMLMLDGMIGQMEEPVTLPEPKTRTKPLSYIPPTGCEGRAPVMGKGEPRLPGKGLDEACEWGRHELWKMYRQWVDTEVMYEEYMMDDAEYVIIAYGSSGRICRDTVNMMRAEGYKVGLFRPITIYPFPEKQIAGLKDRGIKGALVVEMAIPPQFYDDVRLHIDRSIPLGFYARCGGIMVDEFEAMDALKKLIEEVE